MIHPDEAADRLAELDRIIQRALEAIPPDDPQPEHYLPVHRAILQRCHYEEIVAKDWGRPDDPAFHDAKAKAKHQAEFEQLVGRPFDPVRDAITWDEVNALPSHPTGNRPNSREAQAEFPWLHLESRRERP